MNCKKNNIDQLSSALESDGIQENWNSDGIYGITEEIDDIRSKLLEYRNKCECSEMEIYNVNQLINKGTHVLNNVEQEYNNLDAELKEIHCNYVKCIELKSSNDENVRQRINALTLQRDNLRKEFQELNKMADENNKKLMEIKKMITIQEKKNMALVRKLKKMVENVHITSDLRMRVNIILDDPRITNLKKF